MDYAVLALLLGAAAVGVVSSVVRTWSLHQRTYSLEDRVSVLEGILNREVKIRAAAERWKKPGRDEERIEAALAQPAPVQAKNWWEVPGIPRSYSGK